MKRQMIRKRRSKKTRSRIKRLNIPRLCVHRSLNHIYVQILSPENDKILVSAATIEKALREKIKKTGNQKAATEVGKLIATRAKKAGIKKVAFDRSGFKFHGRVKALAEAARKGGLEF